MNIFRNALSRLIYFGLLGLILFFVLRNTLPSALVTISDILGYIVIILIIYILVELLIGLINKPWELIIGTIVLIVTLITFILGFWDKQYDVNLYNTNKIDPKFILLAAVAALGFTLWEYVNLLKEGDMCKKILKAFILITFTAYFIIIALLNTPNIKEYIGLANTDYLTLEALPLTFITLGTKKIQK
ncbi:hypothetical protein AYK81_28710 [Bacillus thuringiensis]|nr:hypothetical protein AYK81_28710 [Bacillus thuringiensis]